MTKDFIKMVQVVPLFSTQHLKGNTGCNQLKTAKKSNG